jgi:hypothetical protein
VTSPILCPEFRELIDRAVVPALLERFLREHREAEGPAVPATTNDRPVALESRP